MLEYLTILRDRGATYLIHSFACLSFLTTRVSRYLSICLSAYLSIDRSLDQRRYHTHVHPHNLSLAFVIGSGCASYLPVAWCIDLPAIQPISLSLSDLSLKRASHTSLAHTKQACMYLRELALALGVPRYMSLLMICLS